MRIVSIGKKVVVGRWSPLLWGCVVVVVAGQQRLCVRTVFSVRSVRSVHVVKVWRFGARSCGLFDPTNFCCTSMADAFVILLQYSFKYVAGKKDA